MIEERDARGRRIRANEPDDAIVEVWKIERHPQGRFVDHDEAAAEIAALREKLEKAEARVAVLTEECRAWHKAEDWLLWDIGEPNDFAAAKREFDEAQRRLDAARAATGPLPAKEGTDA